MFGEMINVAYFTHEYDVKNGSTQSLMNMIHTVKENVNPLVIFPKYGTTVEWFKSEGIKCEVIPFIPHNLFRSKLYPLFRIGKYLNNYFVNKASLSLGIRIIKKYNIQLIHSNTSVIDLGYIISKEIGIPHIYHVREFYNLDFNCIPLEGFRGLKKKLEKSSASIYISKAVQRHYGMQDKPNAYQLYNAIIEYPNSELFKKDKYFIFVGRICKEKGVEDAIRIFNKFSKNHNDYKLKLIGRLEDGYKPHLQKKINLLGLDNQIEYIDFCDVTPYYRHASGLLMCSPMEGLGRVTVEAMNYGCPVIGKNSGGTAEIINNGVNGFLFDNNNQAIELMNKVINPEEANKIIFNAMDMVKIKFGFPNYRKNLLDIYTKTINKRK